MGMSGSSFKRRHNLPRRLSSKKSLSQGLRRVARRMVGCTTYGLSSKDDGTFSDSEDGRGASGLDML
jgi:hypothetical protein